MQWTRPNQKVSKSTTENNIKHKSTQFQYEKCEMHEFIMSDSEYSALAISAGAYEENLVWKFAKFQLKLLNRFCI